jgi:hypothetical protein
LKRIFEIGCRCSGYIFPTSTALTTLNQKAEIRKQKREVKPETRNQKPEREPESEGETVPAAASF